MLRNKAIFIKTISKHEQDMLISIAPQRIHFNWGLVCPEHIQLEPVSIITNWLNARWNFTSEKRQTILDGGRSNNRSYECVFPMQIMRLWSSGISHNYTY